MVAHQCQGQCLLAVVDLTVVSRAGLDLVAIPTSRSSVPCFHPWPAVLRCMRQG